jgi:peptidoglycan/xylan/chitin deacetylase (PgdA/CDA1 family)
VLAALLGMCCKAQDRRVALTFDDLPFAGRATARQAPEINRAIQNALRKHRAPATGFVIGERAEQLSEAARTQILRSWTEGSLELGNHTYSHRDLDEMTVAQFDAELVRGDAVIAPFGVHTRYLRFPFNHTGETQEKHTAVAEVLQAHGYRLAPCTIDTSDYEFADVYAREPEKAKRVQEDYLTYSASEIDYYGGLATKIFGHAVPQVMLLHASQLNADVIEQILQLFERRGYRFITLDEALKDAAYATPETFFTSYGPMWGYRWASELGVKVDGRKEPDPPQWIQDGN